MTTKEKVTYVECREGFDPSMLTLGSLVFDFADPRDLEPYDHEKLSEDELEQWTTADQRKNCWVTYRSGRECSLGGGIVNLAQLDRSKDINDYNVVDATTGSKVEILK